MLVALGSAIALIAGWPMFGGVTSGHPDYEELHNQLDGRVIGAGALDAMLGLHLFLWIRWYRKVLRKTKGLGAVAAV